VTSVEVPDLYPSEPVPVRLANTIWADREGVHDALGTVAQLEQWARQCGLTPTSKLTRDDVDRARALRDAVRRLAAAALDDRRPGAVPDLSAGDALDVLNGFLGAITPELLHDTHGDYQRGWSSNVTGFARALSEVALDAADLLDDAKQRLGACHGPGCVLYFERVPARRGWCSEACGNRARVARHYRRRKADADD
jgi:predicted RNA-binding Zn ribbon-like protein